MITFPDREFIVFDVETTDVEVSRAVMSLPEIVEIGAVKVNCELDVIAEFSELVQPIALTSFTEFSEQITGIKVEELEGAKRFGEVYASFLDFTELNKLRLASWGYFDIEALRFSCRRNKIVYSNHPMHLDLKTFVWGYVTIQGGPVLRAYSIKEILKTLGIDKKSNHRALSDCKLEVAMLKELSEDQYDEGEYKLISL